MLLKKENKTLISLVNKLKAPLPEDVFNGLNKILPFAACEAVILDKQKGVLLTWRDDKFWTGWHLPGSVMRSGEEFFAVLNRVALAELGCKVGSFKFLFPMNYAKGARGHSVSLVFSCKLKGKPKDGKFFKTMPKDIIPEHKELFSRLKREKII